MKAIIDRIEDGIAVLELEDGKLCEISSQFLKGFAEGDVINITFSKSEEETINREKIIKEKLNKLFEE